jgi:hypothetical protein
MSHSERSQADNLRLQIIVDARLTDPDWLHVWRGTWVLAADQGWCDGLDAEEYQRVTGEARQLSGPRTMRDMLAFIRRRANVDLDTLEREEGQTNG